MTRHAAYLRDEVALVGACDRAVQGDPDALADIAFAQLAADPDWIAWDGQRTESAQDLEDHIEDLRQADEWRNGTSMDGGRE